MTDMLPADDMANVFPKALRLADYVGSEVLNRGERSVEEVIIALGILFVDACIQAGVEADEAVNHIEEYMNEAEHDGSDLLYEDEDETDLTPAELLWERAN